MVLFVARLAIDGGQYEVEYGSIDECLRDESLFKLLDETSAEVVLWSGKLRITGSPLCTSKKLKEALVGNASTILRRKL